MTTPRTTAGPAVMSVAEALALPPPRPRDPARSFVRAGTRLVRITAIIVPPVFFVAPVLMALRSPEDRVQAVGLAWALALLMSPLFLMWWSERRRLFRLFCEGVLLEGRVANAQALAADPYLVDHCVVFDHDGKEHAVVVEAQTPTPIEVGAKVPIVMRPRHPKRIAVVLGGGLYPARSRAVRRGSGGSWLGVGR